MTLTCVCKLKDRTKWRVRERMRSAGTVTARSSVVCLGCYQSWRTAASYVAELPNYIQHELQKMLPRATEPLKNPGFKRPKTEPPCKTQPQQSCFICTDDKKAPLCKECQRAYDKHTKRDDGTLTSAYRWVAARVWKAARAQAKKGT